jgi:dethiobiotin synthetase
VRAVTDEPSPAARPSSGPSPSSADVTGVTTHLPAANVVFTSLPGAAGFHFPPMPGGPAPATASSDLDPATPRTGLGRETPRAGLGVETPRAGLGVETPRAGLGVETPSGAANPDGSAPTGIFWEDPGEQGSDGAPVGAERSAFAVPAPRSGADEPTPSSPIAHSPAHSSPAPDAAPSPPISPPDAPEGVPVSSAQVGPDLSPDELPNGEALGAEISSELAAQARPAPHGPPTGEWRGVVLVTGTDTDVGKTVVTAAIAAAAQSSGLRVAVIKPGQTGTATGAPTDIEVINRLAAPDTSRTLADYPEPMAPLAAATVAGMPPLELYDVVDAIRAEADKHDLVLVEGAGGLLVPMGVRPSGDSWTVADLATTLGVRTIVVARAGLGTLNHTALTLEALSRRGVPAGVVIGSWPADPELVHWANFSELVPDMVGALPAGAGRMDPGVFRRSAPGWLTPALYGVLDDWLVWAEETGEGQH